MLDPLSGPEDLIQRLFEELVKNRPENIRSSRSWTKWVMQALGRIGRGQGFDVYSSWSEEPHHSEYLLDCTWFDEREGIPGHGVMALAAESEWGPSDDVRFDFEKLIFVKSPLKLMICDTWRDGGFAGTVQDALEKSLRRYAQNHRIGETYVVLDLHGNAKGQLSAGAHIWKCDRDGPTEDLRFSGPLRFGPETHSE